MERWYVVQVSSGKEERTIRMVEQLIDPELVHECFTPCYQTQAKRRGEWAYVKRKLIPGYVILVTDRIEKVEGCLSSIPAFTRLLRNEEGFTPLDGDEVSWISAFTQGSKSRTVAMSTGIKVGDEVIITDGPLKQHATRIVRIDRKRSTAYVEVTFMGRTKEVPLGLKVLAKR